MVFLNVVLPVFLIIALGFGIRRINFVDKFFLDKIGHLAYFVAVPSLLLAKFLSSASMSEGTRMEIDFRDGFRLGNDALWMLREAK